VNIFQRTEQLARAAGPSATLLLLILLNAVPLHVPYVSVAAPLFPLMALFHFSLFRPEYLPNWLALMFGLLIDVMSGGPLGVHGMVFLVTRYFVGNNQRFLADKPFLVIWFGYAVVSAAAVAGIWAFSALLMWRGIDPRPAVFQFLMSLAFYPFLSWLIGRSQSGANRVVGRGPGRGQGRGAGRGQGRGQVRPGRVG
jgi:rod shape-determining protein MreD